jgi:hypothetical protein
LRRERARYEAERVRRQYDAVEPENRLVARSLERAWEDRLRIYGDTPVFAFFHDMHSPHRATSRESVAMHLRLPHWCEFSR